MVSRGESKSPRAEAPKSGKPAAEGANRRALDRTLTALRALGRLEDTDLALVALCESTADAVDDSPDRASLVKEYRECLVLLGGLGSDGGDAFADLIGRLSASVGDPP